MESLFRSFIVPGAPDADGWSTESLRYRVSPRRPSKFKTVLDAELLFAQGGETQVTTRTRRAAKGEPSFEIEVVHTVRGETLRDHFTCEEQGGMRPRRLVRTVGDARREEADLGAGAFAFPESSYPDVLLPFLMRGEPHDGTRRAAFSWSCDRFCARVYYEGRGEKTVEVPAGRFLTKNVWMYPDLNDWISLGNVVTRLVKPLLPRYNMWFEAQAPHRLIRFEGSYGPPGAPEVVIELI